MENPRSWMRVVVENQQPDKDNVEHQQWHACEGIEGCLQNILLKLNEMFNR